MNAVIRLLYDSKSARGLGVRAPLLAGLITIAAAAVSFRLHSVSHHQDNASSSLTNQARERKARHTAKTKTKLHVHAVVVVVNTQLLHSEQKTRNEKNKTTHPYRE